MIGGRRRAPAGKAATMFEVLEVLVALAMNGVPEDWHASDGRIGALPAGDQRWPSVAPMLETIAGEGWELVGVTPTTAPTGRRVERYVWRRPATAGGKD